ncbi:MAG: ATP-binding protein [Gemmatimonadaceae bacterium]
MSPSGIQIPGKRFTRSNSASFRAEEWGDIFGDETIAAALIDRLVHHCHIVNIRGNSYRMRHHADVSAALRSPGAQASAPPHRTRRPSRQEVPTP